MSFDLAAGYARLAGSEQGYRQAALAELGTSVGVSDLFVVRTAVGYGALSRDEDGVRHGIHLRGEAAYLLDILSWVPFFGLGASMWALDGFGPERLQVRPAAHLLLGLDYLASRAWIVGVDLRTGLLWEPAGSVSATSVQLRWSRMFELF